MDSYISFEEGHVDDATELVGDRVIIDLRTLHIGLTPVDSTERVSVPLTALKRVELEETPTVIDSRGH